MKMSSVFFGILAMPTFDGLREYYEKSESFLASAKKDHRAKIDEQVQKMKKDLALTDEEEFAEWSVLMDGHEATYDMLFTNFFRYSFIVLATLVLEDHLYRLCLALQEKTGNREDVPIPGGDNINTYKNYILNEIKVSVQPRLWDWIDDLRYVRNCIVHASGDITRSKKERELKALAKRNVGIHISGRVERTEMTPLYLNDNMLMIESRYCETVIDGIETLFKEIIKTTGLPTKITFAED